MSYPSRMKNPDLLYPSVAAALRAYVLRPASLNVQLPWEPLLPSLAYQGWGLLRPSYALPIACCVLLLLLVSYILTIPCVLSLILTITIYTMPPSPLRPIKGIRGIYLFQPPNTKRQAGYIYVYSRYLLCLGPSY